MLKNTGKRRIILFFMDLILLGISFFAAFYLRFEEFEPSLLAQYIPLLPIIIIYLAAYMLFGTYNVLWRYAGVREVSRLCIASATAAVTITILSKVFKEWQLSITFNVMMCILAIGFTGGARLGWRIIKKHIAAKRTNSNKPQDAGNLMVVGAGMAGSCVVTMCENDTSFGRPTIFVDDDPTKQGCRIQNIKVAGTIDDVPRLATKYDISEIIIAIPSLPANRMHDLVMLCKTTKCRIRISNLANNEDESSPVKLRELNISDVLARDEVKLNFAEISNYLQGKTVFVTGGGGSIGSELCRQIMKFSPKLLIIFDIYENCAYELACELRQQYGKDAPILVLIGSIREKARLDEIFDEYAPEIVFHAAAHKHVPLMEDSPAEAVKNNIVGTRNLLRSASEHNVERFVQLSTDKAVNPTNVMGSTKRITEMMIQCFAKRSQMKCMAVRFGNVLGSHGSVIPLFEAQIKKGGPVTVTHPDIIRYFMTIPEAAQLVLSAGAIAITGSIFVLDMGDPVKIVDLAEKIIRFYGYEPNVNMEIAYTGLRPGEKMYEELLMDEELGAMKRTSHDKIMIAPSMDINEPVFEIQLKQLIQASEHNDNTVKTLIRAIIPTYGEKKSSSSTSQSTGTVSSTDVATNETTVSA